MFQFVLPTGTLVSSTATVSNGQDVIAANYITIDHSSRTFKYPSLTATITTATNTTGIKAAAVTNEITGLTTRRATYNVSGAADYDRSILIGVAGS